MDTTTSNIVLVRTISSNKTLREHRKEVTLWIHIANELYRPIYYINDESSSRNFLGDVTKIDYNTYHTNPFQMLLMGDDHKKKCPGHDKDGITFKYVHGEWRSTCTHVISKAYKSELNYYRILIIFEEQLALWLRLQYLQQIMGGNIEGIRDIIRRIMEVYRDDM